MRLRTRCSSYRNRARTEIIIYVNYFPANNLKLIRPQLIICGRGTEHRRSGQCAFSQRHPAAASPADAQSGRRTLDPGDRGPFTVGSRRTRDFCRASQVRADQPAIHGRHRGQPRRPRTDRSLGDRRRERVEQLAQGLAGFSTAELELLRAAAPLIELLAHRL